MAIFCLLVKCLHIGLCSKRDIQLALKQVKQFTDINRIRPINGFKTANWLHGNALIYLNHVKQ